MRPRRLMLAVIAAMAMLIAACSPEELAERAIESQEGIDDIEIDDDDGSVKIEGQDDDGDVTAVIGGGEVPDGFPIPVPSGGTVKAVFEQESGATVSISYSANDFASVKAFYEDWVAKSGFDLVNKFESSNPASVAWTLESGEDAYTVTVADSGMETLLNLFAGSG